MKDLVIIGAGAIGRGYLPWVFSEQEFRYIFVDSNAQIVEAMRSRGSFSTYRARNGRLEKKVVQVAAAWTPDDFRLSETDPAAVFICVGPRHCAATAKLVEGAACPVIMLENDPATVDLMKSLTGLQNVMFAIPDVITSNSAPAEILADDPLALVTEDGSLFIDASLGDELRGDFVLSSADEIRKQWTAKLFLHNTPHCVAAYLGALLRVKYVHESMQVPEASIIVEGVMKEMLNCLKLTWEIPHDFLEWYAEKELARFRNELLHDPISRVAREPLRKLELEGRLVGAAQLCLAQGFVPNNLLLGIASAVLFDNPRDADSHLTFLRRSVPSSALLTNILGLRRGEALELVLRNKLDDLMSRLQSLALQTDTGLAPLRHAPHES